jgi:hypothetical protein
MHLFRHGAHGSGLGMGNAGLGLWTESGSQRHHRRSTVSARMRISRRRGLWFDDQIYILIEPS